MIAIIPMLVRAQVWDLLRPYKDQRFKLHWGPIRPSVDLEAVLKAVLGPDQGGV